MSVHGPWTLVIAALLTRMVTGPSSPPTELTMRDTWVESDTSACTAIARPPAAVMAATTAAASRARPSEA